MPRGFDQRDHGLRRADHHGVRDADPSAGGRHAGVVLRLHVRCGFRAGLGALMANQDEVVHRRNTLMQRCSWSNAADAARDHQDAAHTEDDCEDLPAVSPYPTLQL